MILIYRGVDFDDIEFGFKEEGKSAEKVYSTSLVVNYRNKMNNISEVSQPLVRAHLQQWPK